nr:MAG TPA: DNA-directed RNA polymerase [Caudoviricetes sp.]
MLENAQIISNGEYYGYCTEDVRLNSIPAADVVEVRHGRWIHPHWCNDVSAADCSECGFEAQHREYRGVQKYYKLCPSCGALMDKEDDK